MSYFNNGQLNLSSQEKTYYKKSKVIYTNQSYKQKKNHSLYLNFKYGHMFCAGDFCFPKYEKDFVSSLLGGEDLTPESEDLTPESEFESDG